jgi:hypothetical protein
LLVIPRQDIPMCWNCYARLRQDEDLVGEKLAVRRYIFYAALLIAKLIDGLESDTGIALGRISQACLLVLDLYRTAGKRVIDMMVQVPANRRGNSVCVGGKLPSTCVGILSSETKLPRGQSFPSHVTRGSRAKGISAFLEAL